MGVTPVELSGLGHAIQLAVAPVFLLTAIATMLNLLASRLARIVDRARVMEAQLRDPGSPDHGELRERLQVVSVRSRLINRAIALSVFSAILVCLVVVGLFVGSLAGLRLDLPVVVTFVAAMLSLALALIYFLREVFIATVALRFQAISQDAGR